ncbi:ABC transporter permease [Hymenobacter sp. AT01-02]|uniref:ABC transporter permease n=1 Tax=Hymenobacter sp. AT01-02 TaxID=1571877 RepID=UPI0005F1FAAC|nr:ABC transporter permease [Hymenobacter sp. AT01-02]
MSTALAPSFALPAAPGLLTQLHRCLAADYQKLRRTVALWLAVGGGALPVLLNFCIFYSKGQYIIKPGQNPWPQYVSMSWQTSSILLLPLFMVLLTGLLTNVEHRASGWKHVHALPVGRWAVYSSKLLILLQLTLLAETLYVVLLLGAGVLLGWLRPGLGFQANHPDLLPVATMLGHTFIATLGMLGVQYVAALWWRGMVGPLGLGIAGIVTGLTLLRWEHIDLIPYAATTRVLGALGGKGALTVNPHMMPAEWYSLAWFAGSLLLGYWLLRMRRAD